jgi:hypothetical protein
VLEASGRVLLRATGGLHDAVERQERVQDELSHLRAPSFLAELPLPTEDSVKALEAFGAGDGRANP